MVGEGVDLYHGNMAISDTPRQLYTMIGEDVANSPWQYGYKLYTTAIIHHGREGVANSPL